MPRAFSQATAEQVITVSEASVALRSSATVDSIRKFVDLPTDHTKNALALAEDLGLLEEKSGIFFPASPLCRLLRTPHDQERAAVLRITIESYKPFLIFREELEATNDPTAAASRTKTRLDLECHREEVKDTLLNLATYSGALVASHGNVYERDLKSVSNLLLELASGSREESAAIFTVREELGAEAANLVNHEDVVLPLATSLRHASGGGAGREAVLHAGIALESFLDWYAMDRAVDLAGANGVNAKLDTLRQRQCLPKKLVFTGKYVGHARNAADHGNDTDIGAPWSISDATGRNIVFVAANFIKSVIAYRDNNFEI